VAGREFFSVVMAALVIVNASAFIYNLWGMTEFSAVGNTVSVALICYAVHVIMRGSAEVGADKKFVLVSTVLVAVSVVGNIEVVSPVVVVKYLGIYLLYVAGRVCGGPLSRFELYCVAVLAVLPMAFMALGTPDRGRKLISRRTPISSHPR